MPASLSPEMRRTQILELLDRQGECGIDELAERFGVSGMTIRRDLQELADEGRVIRTHGGATPTARITFEFKFLARTQEQNAEKEQIAEVAARLVQPGESVLLDSSTTTLAIARRLRAIPDLTVITTSLPIASELFGCESIDVLILGGKLRKDSPDLFGALTDIHLDALRVNVAFIGADAVDRSGYIYNQSAEIGRMLHRMSKAAARVYAVADHSKIGRQELMHFANVADWSGLITDDKLNVTMQQTLIRAGVSVIRPSSSPSTNPTDD